MSDQESERPGGTQPGLKKSDVLTRQTEDGSFEFIVESGSTDNFGYAAESSVEPGENVPLPVRASDKKRARLIGAGVLLLILLIGVGFALSKSSNFSGKTDDPASEQEVSGFRPYGGGEAVPAARVNRPKADPNPRSQRVVVPFEEPEDQFAEEIIEEMPPNVDPIPEAEWKDDEAEQTGEEDEGQPSRLRRSLARDRMNFRRLDSRNIKAEKLRAFSVGEQNQQAKELDQRSLRNIERSVRTVQLDDSAIEYQEEDMYYDDEDQELEEDFIDDSEYENEYLEADKAEEAEIIF